MVIFHYLTLPFGLLTDTTKIAQAPLQALFLTLVTLLHNIKRVLSNERIESRLHRYSLLAPLGNCHPYRKWDTTWLLDTGSVLKAEGNTHSYTRSSRFSFFDNREQVGCVGSVLQAQQAPKEEKGLWMQWVICYVHKQSKTCCSILFGPVADFWSFFSASLLVDTRAWDFWPVWLFSPASHIVWVVLLR